MTRNSLATVVGTVSLGTGWAAATVWLAASSALSAGPLPYSNADAVMQVRTVRQSGLDEPGSFLFNSNVADALEAALAGEFEIHRFTYRDARIQQPDGTAELRLAQEVTPAHFEVLGVRPTLGRTFTADDIGQRVVVVSQRYWRDRLSSRPDAIGLGVRVNGESHAILGVMPPNADDPSGVFDLWFVRDELGFRASGPTSCCVGAYVSPVTEARRALLSHRAEVAARTAQALVPVTADSLRLRFVPVREVIREPFAARALPVSGALSAILLMTAAINFAVLVLLAQLSRGHENAVRSALGEPMSSIVSRVAAESGLRVLLSLVLGLALALWMLDGARILDLGLFPEWLEGRLDWGAGGTLALGALILTTACAVPSFRAALASSSYDSLRSGQSGTKGSTRTISALVALQLAAVSALLPTTAVAARLAFSDSDASRGFDPSGLVHLRFDATSPPDGRSTLSAALFALSSAPDVQSVSLGDFSHLSDVDTIAVVSDGSGTERMLSGRGRVAFEGLTMLRTLGISASSGKFPLSGDDRALGDIAIVSESAARALSPGRTAIDSRLILRGPMADGRRYSVVAVVPDIKLSQLEGAGNASAVYLDGAGTASAPTGAYLRIGKAVARDRRGVAALVASRLPASAAHELSFVEDVLLDGQRRARRALLALGSLWLVVALLGLAGAFAVVAFEYRIRVRELAIRRALGAGPVSIAWLLGRQLCTRVAVAVLGGGAVGWMLLGESRSVLSSSPALVVAVALVPAFIVLLGVLPVFVGAWRADIMAVISGSAS